MLQSECDTDDDCDAYFLKPVNEYNIVEKIKEANKQLFVEEQITVTGDSSTEHETELKNYVKKLNTCSGRKVTFALHLVNYEPQLPSVDGVELEFVAEDDDERPLVDLIDSTKTINELSLEHDNSTSIIEELISLPTERTKNDDDISQVDIEDEELKEEIEEICEEIIVMDMDSGIKLDKDTEEMNKPTTYSSNESIENLQLSSIETANDEDESAALAASTTPADDVRANHHNELATDDEDDDNYSILVASYLSDNHNYNKLSSAKKNSRFSFRRKKHFLCPESKRNRSQHDDHNLLCQHDKDGTMADIKFNYRTCCEYRDAILPEKLPKYTGYLSEYGLSQDQWEKREQKLQRRQRSSLERTLKTSEHELRRMQDNDRAFTTWLKNKMRFPINRTRNMFDVKAKATHTNSNSNGSATNKRMIGNKKS